MAFKYVAKKSLKFVCLSVRPSQSDFFGSSFGPGRLFLVGISSNEVVQ